MSSSEADASHPPGVEQQEQEQHEAQQQCPHSKAGCAWQGSAQDNVQSHVQLCAFARLDALAADTAASLSAMNTRVSALEAENEALRFSISTLSESLRVFSDRLGSVETHAVQLVTLATESEHRSLAAEQERLQYEMELLKSSTANAELHQSLQVATELGKLAVDVQDLKSFCRDLQRVLGSAPRKQRESSATTPAPFPSRPVSSKTRSSAGDNSAESGPQLTFKIVGGKDTKL
ncbi:hypothetical protein RI367_000721 [Sorochytrium milnesiophthora]